MPLLDFPPELLLLIGENLSIKDLSRFLRANRYLSRLLTPHFHKLAVQAVGDLSALHWAARRGHASLAELVLSKGGGLEDFKQGRRILKTPLHIAAAKNHPDVIRVLAKDGRWINARGRWRNTPLHAAAAKGSPQAIRVLLELGADMTCINVGRETPMRIAAKRGDIDCMKAFIDAGWDFNHERRPGWTVLHQATLGGKEMVEFLLEHGGKVLIDAQDNSGKTPLHWAVCAEIRWSTENEGVTRTLCYHGADTEMKDHRGRTPLDLAIGQESLTRVLLEHRPVAR